MKTTWLKCGGMTMLLFVAACGSSAGSGGGGSTSDTVSSLDQLPDIESMVQTNTTGSLSAKAVSGTAPLLFEIDATAADTDFWGGLIAEINAPGNVIDQDDINRFWEGEGSCRMAQDTGFSFQNIQQAGTSLCFMKNMPAVLGADAIVTNSIGITDPEETFVQRESSHVVQVQVSNMPAMGEGEEEGGAETVFIRVYGSSTTEGAAGYAVDIWFCGEGETTAGGYEQIRVDGNTLTQTTIETGFGTFQNEFTASLTTDAGGNFIIDPAQTRGTEFFFSSGDFGSGKGSVSIDAAGQLTSNGWWQFSWGDEGYTHVVSEYTGESAAALRFEQAGFATQWKCSECDDFESAFYGATEWQDDHYEPVASGDLFDAINNFDFSTQSFWDGTLAVDAALLAARSDYSCSESPDLVVSMDFSESAVLAIATTCQQDFQNMNFCDGADIQAARQLIFEAQQMPQPE